MCLYVYVHVCTVKNECLFRSIFVVKTTETQVTNELVELSVLSTC